MKKKILSLLLLLTSVFLLVGCIDARATTPYVAQTEHEEAVINAIEQTENAVVAVVTGTGHGSGVIVKKENIDNQDALYYVLTNHHVIENADDINIYYGVRSSITGSVKPTTKPYFVKDLQSTPEYDIAMLRFVAPRNLDVDVLPIISTNENRLEIKKGQTVIAIGSPYKWKEYFNYATIGIVSQVDFIWNNVEKLAIKHDVAINPGNSGGALINLKGELIGINTSKIANISTSTGTVAAEGLGHALNINVVGPHVTSYKESDYELVVKKPRLGITVMNLVDFKNPVNQFDTSKIADTENGVVVVNVDTFRGAFGKVFEYDVIIKANNQDITDTASLAQILGTMNYGQVHNLVLLRLVNGVATEVTVSIEII